MRLFKKKSPSAQKAPSAPPAAPAAAGETPSPAPTDEQMKSSRFSIRRPASPTADEAAPPDGYTNMDDTKSIELPQKQPSREVEQSGKDNQESKDEEDESVAVQVTELDLTWMGFMCLWIWCAIPCVVYLLLFTQMGYGELFYYTLSTRFSSIFSIHLSGILLISTFLYYVLDIDEWSSSIFGKVMRFVLTLSLFGLFVLWILLVSNDIPYGIITMFAIFNPLWLLLVKNVFYRKVDTRTYVGWLGGPLLVLTLMTAVAFLVWVVISPENQWNRVTRLEAAERTGCAADFEEYPACSSNNSTEYGSGGGNSTDDAETCFYLEENELVFPDGCEKACIGVYSGCLNGLILWAGPLLMCLSMMFLGLFCRFFRNEDRSEKDILNYAKIWIVALGIMWISASLAGTSADATSSLMALTMASLAAAAIFLTAAFSKDERKSNKETMLTSIREKYGDNLDVARGLLVVTCSPFIVIYLLLSMMNQLVRRVRINPCSQPASSGEDSANNASIFTVRANKHLTRMRSWDRTRVFTYSVYWGVAYMILQVIVSKLTVVFLSWMIEKTAEMGLFVTTAITCGVGVVMFLLPPVPGVPVYLTLGIVLTARGYDSIGWIYSVLFSTAVGTLLKLFSSALQQKLIGENLSHFVKIRQFVGINSQLMKAMRLVVGQSGFSVAKVAILIGGPDWPTSVLCGIMRLSLVQIMIGTLPIVFLIFPTCLMGALIYLASLDSDSGNPVIPWAGTAATICASVTAAVQFGSMIVAAYYLERTGKQRQAEIDAIEIDQEVKEADDRDDNMKKCYASVTQWRSISFCMKAVLVSSVVTITASCYMVQFFSSLCFVGHELTDSVSENLEGNVANLFLPLGWAAIGLFSASIVFLQIFIKWGNRKAKSLASDDNAAPILDNSNIA